MRCLPLPRILGLFSIFVSLLSLMSKFGKPASNKNDGLYQRMTHSYVHWSNRVLQNASCFRID